MVFRIIFAFFLLFCSCALQTLGMYDGTVEEGTADPDVMEVPPFIEQGDVIDDDPVGPDQPVDGEEDIAGDVEEIEYPEGWLPGWGNRVRLAMDPGDIDEGLRDFPLLVHLSVASGIGPVDVSRVFQELRSDDNRFKISVTDGDGTTEFFVEIEKWDSAVEEAWLWVGVPQVDPEVETILYLYFDAYHPDNTGQVGGAGSTPAREVWDDGAYAGVWHLAALGGWHSVRDSTLNGRDGTPQGGMAAAGSGITGDAAELDGVDDYIDIGAVESTGWMEVTVEAWFLAHSFNDGRLVCQADDSTVSKHAFSLGVFNNGSNRYLKVMLATDGSGGDTANLNSSSEIEGDKWYYGAMAWSYEDGRVVNWLEGGTVAVLSLGGASLNGTSQPVCIGTLNPVNASSDKYFEGIIDEVRISTMRRSDAWLRATYESGIDDMVTFGSLETFP